MPKSANKKGRTQVEIASEVDIGSVTTANTAGDVAHDSADSGNPIKIGAKAIDMAPDTDAEQGASAVAADDRVNILTDLQGALVERVNARYNVFDNVSTTYDDVTTTATCTAVNCEKYREITFGYTLAVGAGTPTNMTVQVEISLDGTNYFDWQSGEATQTETTAGGYAYTIANLSCQKIKFTFTATGTTASDTFVVTNAAMYLRN